MNERLLMAFVIVGTIPAAISGAMLGIKKKMDIFGSAILALTTGVGGGVIRDLVLGNTPPATFRDPVYALVALCTGLLTFMPAVHRLFEQHAKLYDMLMTITDSLGLGVFTVVGVQTAYGISAEYRMFLLVFVGTITGVGGGILRDLLAGDVPYIFAKHHFYACACVLGAFLTSLLWPIAGDFWAMLIGSVFIFILRMLAAVFHWKLPDAG